MFRQQIENGEQVELPENWLAHGNPWEFPRPEVTYEVQFGGQVVAATVRAVSHVSALTVMSRSLRR